MENTIEMDALGVPLFSETSMCRAGKDEFYFTALLAWKMSFSTLGVKISSGNPKECPGF